ncbi:hypothetical protein FRX31_031088, partial [Thalictrum thalictroides]
MVYFLNYDFDDLCTIDKIREAFSFPDDVELKFCDKIKSTTDPKIAFDNLKAKLHFPFSAILYEYLNLQDLAVGQLTPHSYRFLVYQGILAKNLRELVPHGREKAPDCACSRTQGLEERRRNFFRGGVEDPELLSRPFDIAVFREFLQ